MRERIIKISFLLLIVFGVVVGQNARAEDVRFSEADIPTPKDTSFSSEQLRNKGCVDVQWGSDNSITYPKDTRLFHPVGEEVSVRIDSWSDVFGTYTEDKPKLLSCPNEMGSEIPLADPENKPLEGMEADIVWIINKLLTMGLQLAVWVLGLCSFFLTWFMSVGSFITNPMVQAGWPVVQGFANLGFILALLFIAFSFTLRLEQFQPRRLLPRLLIAALLINFSLVIGGVMIDASRLMMAVMARTVSTGDISSLGEDILVQSGYLSQHFDKTTGVRSWHYPPTEDKSWGGPINLLKITGLAWGLAIGMAIATIGFLIRYIMLILLLIASPIAYLAIVIPGADNLAKKWWSQFIGWILYGPIALLVLILATVIGGRAITAGNGMPKELSEVLNILVSIALMVAAASAGKVAAMAGAGGVLNMVQGKGKAAAKWAWNNPGKTAALATAATGGLAAIPAAGGLLASMGAKAARNQARDFYGATKTGLRNRLGLAERDEKGNLAKGASSVGSRLGARVGGGKYGIATTGQRNEATKATRAVAGFRSGRDISRDIEASPDVLKQAYVGEQISTADAVAMTSHTGNLVSHSQKKALLSNTEVVKKLIKENPAELQRINNLPTNLPTDLPTNLPTDMTPAGQANARQNHLNKLMNESNKKINEDNKELIKTMNDTIGRINNPK